MKMIRKPIARALSPVLAGILSVWLGTSQATMIAWTDWTSASTTSATGVIGGTIAVNFTGLISPEAQTATGIPYWGDAGFGGGDPATYTSPPDVDNPPPDPDIIRLTGGSVAGTQTITFSAPVVDPVMAILSLGRFSQLTTYVFGNEDFDILNVGPGYWGAGSLTKATGNVLEGLEGHGVIRFNGTFSSIDWTIPTGEFWHGFTIGVTQHNVPTVPAPSSISLLGLGLALVGLARRRRRERKPRLS